MNKQCSIAQRYSVIIAAAGDEQDFSGTKILLRKQVACNADMPALAKQQGVLLQPYAGAFCALSIEYRLKAASR